MLTRMKKFLRLFVAVLVIATLNATPLYAITPNDRDAVNLDSPYYDPNSCDDSGGTGVAAGSTKKGVFIIGDKITSLAKTEILKAIPNAQMSNDDFREIKEAPDVIEKEKDKIAKVGSVIVELGTWGRMDNIDTTIKKIKEVNPDATIYWVDIMKGVGDITADFNKEIYEQQNKGYKVISWFKTVFPDGDPKKGEDDLKDNKKYLQDDHVSPTDAGQTALAQTLAKGIGTTTASAASGTTCGCGDNSSVDVSAVAPGIPEAWRQLLAKVAAQFKTNPNFVAALYMSENGNVWYPLNKRNWGVSGAGAAGVMQFMPGTWQAYKADGDGDGKEDINNVADSIAAAAKYAKALGVDANTPLGNIDKPLTKNTFLRSGASYNAGPKNVQDWGENAPLSALYKETENYVKNIYTLVKSNFTKSGHPNYGEPRIAGDLKGKVGEGGTGDTSAAGANCSAGGEVIGNVVFYSQIDPRWKDTATGEGSTIGRSGCGATSFAMVAATLTGNNSITPAEINKLWNRKNWWNSGTSWAAFAANGAAKEYGLKAETIRADQSSRMNQTDIDKIIAAIKAGKLVIVSGDHVSSQLFTGPHIIVIRGVTADGKFLVNDPKDDPKLKQQTSKQWDKSVLMTEAYAAWAFSK